MRCSTSPNLSCSTKNVGWSVCHKHVTAWRRRQSVCNATELGCTLCRRHAQKQTATDNPADAGSAALTVTTGVSTCDLLHGSCSSLKMHYLQFTACGLQVALGLSSLSRFPPFLPATGRLPASSSSAPWKHAVHHFTRSCIICRSMQWVQFQPKLSNTDWALREPATRQRRSMSMMLSCSAVPVQCRCNIVAAMAACKQVML